MKGKNIRALTFVLIAFLLGSINVLYNIAFYILLVIAFGINLSYDFKGFWQNVRLEKKYVILPLLGGIYLVIHYLCSLFMDIPYKPSWSMMELLLLYFFFVPLYLLSAKGIMSYQLLRRALFALCWGVIFFNLTKLFCITGFSLFTEPVDALNLIYTGRFGGNMELLGGQVYLEPQALYICISAVISYYFMLNYNKASDCKTTLWSSMVIFVFSVVFLSFTVTKGSILAFIVGFLLISVIYFRKKSVKYRLIFTIICVSIILLGYSLMPNAYMARIEQVKSEIHSVQEGDYKGGSIAPRLGLMKENFSHFKEFGLLGLGVYKAKMVREWYATSPYQLGGIYNSHNSFVEYWLIGGIPGLFFILFYFISPILRMRKNHQYSFLIIACILTIFIAANTCVVTILIDSAPFVIFMLSLFFLYWKYFEQLDQNSSGSGIKS